MTRASWPPIVLGALLALYLVACLPQTRREVWNGDMKNHVVIYFDIQASDHAIIDEFWHDVLTVPVRGTEVDHLPGVKSLISCRAPSGYGAICVMFSPYATKQQRASVLARIRADARPYRVLENVAPNAVEQLD